MKIHPGKLGTIPMLLQFRYRYALRLGQAVLYRPVHAAGRMGVPLYWEPDHGDWRRGVVEQVDPLRLSRM